MKGYVYILSNESMPGIVKIGSTKYPSDRRASELDNTSVPTPFLVEYEIFSEDAITLEMGVHEALHYCRVSANREFFRCTVEQAVSAVRLCIDYIKPSARPTPQTVACDDSRLGWAARGMLAFLRLQDDEWKFSTQEIVAATSESMSPSGRDATGTILRELEAAGYVARHNNKRFLVPAANKESSS